VLTTPIEHRACRRLTADERTVDLLHARTRAPAERGDSLLETTIEALRQVSLRPRRIGAVTDAALSCSTMSTTAPHDHHRVRAVAGTVRSCRRAVRP
jgi:hypothetical protein